MSQVPTPDAVDDADAVDAVDDADAVNATDPDINLSTDNNEEVAADNLQRNEMLRAVVAMFSALRLTRGQIQVFAQSADAAWDRFYDGTAADREHLDGVYGGEAMLIFFGHIRSYLAAYENEFAHAADDTSAAKRARTD